MGSRLDANSTAVRKRIEKHTFEDEKGEEYESSRFGGFTDYFRRKKIKLQNLDAERRSNSTGNPPIFRGIVAHVNGYTQPSLNDLHALIVSYGGGFMQYLDGKTTVTHIIASNLTPKKKIEFRRYRIVKPAWVVDSVQAKKLLPWDAYRVLDEGVGQQVLGFDDGKVVSQVNSQQRGYRDQTDKSWYTSQVKGVAQQLATGEVEAEIDNNRKSLSSSTHLLGADHDNAHRENDHENDRLYGPISLETRDSTSAVPHPDIQRPPPHTLAHTTLSEPTEGTDPSPFDEQGFRDSNSALDQPKSPGPDHVTDDNESLHPQSQLNDEDGLNDTPWANKSALTAEEHNAVLLADPRVWKSTVVNPDFLKQYYQESRLHHLSTWKADLKAQLQALTAEKSPSQQARSKPAPGTRRYILHVDFDSFFAAVSLRKFPQYIEQPAVVAHGGGSGSEIASCNYPARNFGIKNGMWMKAAQQLCSDLKVLPYDFPAYEEASRSFYEAVLSTGGIVQSVSVDEALVDLSVTCIAAGGHDGKAVSEGSIWREQAKADEIAQGLRDRIKIATGCAVSVGIGGNILLAKVALRKAKPAGQYQIKPEEVLEILGGLTVQDLPGVAYSIGGKLEEIGVKLVKDIREISKEKLVSTLGPKTGEKIWEYARGIDRTEVGEQVVRKSVSAEVNWGIRFVTQAQAEEFVQSLCDELHRRLTEQKVKGRQLTMKIMRRAADAPLDPPKHLGHGKCDTYNRSLVLGVATNAREVIRREAVSILRGFGFSPGELRGIGIQMTKLEPLRFSIDGQPESSQKRLQFKISELPRDRFMESEDPILDDVEILPHKNEVASRHLATATIFDSPAAGPQKPLNTLGTQFMLPTQVDPSVLAELPDDIRSKFQQQRLPTSNSSSREQTPFERAMPESPRLRLDTLPNLSQLDQETLDALPDDVRTEIMSFYTKSPRKIQSQSLLPQSPRKVRSIALPRKQTTPTKRRIGLLSRGRATSKFDSKSTLTQSNFVATRITNNNLKPTTPFATTESESEEVSPDFLDALPEDIRREVLAQQRRDRLKKRGGIDVNAKKRLHNRPHRNHGAPGGGVGQRRLRLPPRAPKPTFTAEKLSALPELRDAVSAWYGEFLDDGPYREDVDALVKYLGRVVVEERDMSKAVALVKWLGWVVDEGGGGGNGDGQGAWREALETVRQGVQDMVRRRGLGSVEF
ncbi:deoxycytidyl transferase [Acarospora aff. strigata]|nr:deoxycytidyl transferase [Acarospora aff. strigata]